MNADKEATLKAAERELYPVDNVNLGKRKAKPKKLDFGDGEEDSNGDKESAASGNAKLVINSDRSSV